MEIDDQDKRTRRARLLAGSPEFVFGELQRYGAVVAEHPFDSDKELEKLLLARKVPLIDLGLAMHAREDEVVMELYKRACRAATDEADVQYLKGLRIAVLTNRNVNRFSFPAFPQSLIGDEETKRILATAEWDETEALLRNPTAAVLLKAVYERKGYFADLPDDRWLSLVRMTVGNARLITREDGEDGPDLEHMDLSAAAFGLLEIAPVNNASLNVLQSLYDYLDPEQIWSRLPLAPAIERWRNCEVTDYKGKPREGYYTQLDMREEFLCLVACLFDKRTSDDKTKTFGDVNSPDIVRRAAYYAKANLTLREMTSAQQKDKAFFAYATYFNDHVLMSPTLRKYYEEECLSGDLARFRYRTRCERLHRRWRSFDPKPIAEWLQDDTEDAPGIDIAAALADLQKGLAHLTQQVSRILNVTIFSLIILAILLYLRH